MSNMKNIPELEKGKDVSWDKSIHESGIFVWCKMDKKSDKPDWIAACRPLQCKTETSPTDVWIRKFLLAHETGDCFGRTFLIGKQAWPIVGIPSLLLSELHGLPHDRIMDVKQDIRIAEDVDLSDATTQTALVAVWLAMNGMYSVGAGATKTGGLVGTLHLYTLSEVYAICKWFRRFQVPMSHAGITMAYMATAMRHSIQQRGTIQEEEKKFVSDMIVSVAQACPLDGMNSKKPMERFLYTELFQLAEAAQVDVFSTVAALGWLRAAFQGTEALKTWIVDHRQTDFVRQWSGNIVQMFLIRYSQSRVIALKHDDEDSRNNARQLAVAIQEWTGLLQIKHEDLKVDKNLVHAPGVDLPVLYHAYRVASARATDKTATPFLAQSAQVWKNAKPEEKKTFEEQAIQAIRQVLESTTLSKIVEEAKEFKGNSSSNTKDVVITRLLTPTVEAVQRLVQVTEAFFFLIQTCCFFLWAMMNRSPNRPPWWLLGQGPRASGK